MGATRGAVTLVDEERSKGAILDGIAMPRPPSRVGRARGCLSRSLMLPRPVKAGKKWVSIASFKSGMVRIK